MAYDDRYIKDKSKKQLVGELKETAKPNSPVHKQMEWAIVVQCVKDIENSIGKLTNVINKADKSSNKLSNRIFVLNCILGFISIIGVVFTILSFYK